MGDTKTQNIGTVYLIGAGPGDPELITVRALRLLREADAVVYDNLIGLELVVSLPSHVERHYVGKRAGKHALPQDQINELLVRLAREGKTVARLKGGDPFIFGRGGEEARTLHANNIPFEVVPGITAGIAAPAYAGIPCTDREAASFVTFATGHKAGDKDLSSVDWDWMAGGHKGTLVIYMGVGELEHIVSTLIGKGMSPDTPSAMIERGTFPSQRSITAPLSGLPAKAKEFAIKAPAITIIGEVAALQPDMDWFMNMPLLGKRVMVLRPADQAEDMYASLRRLGAEVLTYPTIATDEVIDTSAWDAFGKITGDNRWLVFTSENGVRYFARQYLQRHADIRSLAHFRIAAIGAGTSRALADYHLTPDFVPLKATVASLAMEMTAELDLEGASVVRVRGNLADQTIEDALVASGATVLPQNVYRTYHPQWPEGFAGKLFEHPPEIIMFTSGSTAKGLVEMLTDDEVSSLTGNALLASIGPSTSDIIRSLGMTVAIEATTHSVPGLIDELVRYVTANPEDHS
ncbi:MAG: uroporphyrinogen-III C-methyltransferase [candidate division Zixibacteria bacterium]|nr:uroporphyrinogen-III C-methyltransferase [candidate division Zixibacteria bacterium]